MIRQLALPLLLAAISVQASAAPATPSDALASFYAALTAGDKTTALELLAPQVAIYESGFVEASRDEYAHHHLGGDIEFAKRSVRRVLKHSEKIEGKVAIIWEETETKANSGGKTSVSLGTETAVLEQDGDQWRITHVHWSSRKK